MNHWSSRFGLLAGLCVVACLFAQDPERASSNRPLSYSKATVLADARAGLPTILTALQDEKKDAPVYGKGYKPLAPEVKARLHAQNVRLHGPNYMKRLAANTTAPAAFDCVTMGWVPPIRDQGSCGSCYLVSTMDGLTCAGIKAGYGKADDTYKMSDQWGMDCHSFGGCGGGNGTEVIEYIRTHGAPAERYINSAGQSVSDYPAYIARSSTCRLKAGAKLWPCDWGFVSGDPNNRAATVDEIKAALLAHGTLNISLDAGGQFMNGTGIITALGTSIDHEISLVGWDDAKNALKIRNQWNTSWGNGGYRWLDYKAAAHLVDVFWISMTPVVPPPVPPVPPLPPPVPGAIAVTPAASVIVAGGTQQYAADKGPVIWTTTGGTITATGLLTAPAATGSFQVKAFLQSDPNVWGVASFSVGQTPPVPPTPPSGTLVLGMDVKAGSYELVPAGAIARFGEINSKIRELEALLLKVAPTMKEPPRE